MFIFNNHYVKFTRDEFIYIKSISDEFNVDLHDFILMLFDSIKKPILKEKLKALNYDFGEGDQKQL